jgi:hypothetical protein
VSVNVNLSEEQRRILKMLTEDYLTPKQISSIRETSIQSVYKTMNKLKKKGFLTGGFNRGFKKTVSTQDFKPPSRLKNKGSVSGGNIRLHGQEFNIKILNKGRGYERARIKKDLLLLDNNTVRLYKDSIEVYSDPNKNFMGDDEQRATALSFLYWNKFFSRLEDKLNIVFIKGFNTCIKQVKAHYSEVNNELAQDCNKRKVKLRIYAREDSRLWFEIDNSFNFNEAETTHRETSKQDMGKVKPFFQDLRDNNPPLISDVMKLIKVMAEQNKETASGLNTVVTLLRPVTTKEDNGPVLERPGYVG